MRVNRGKIVFKFPISGGMKRETCAFEVCKHMLGGDPVRQFGVQKLKGALDTALTRIIHE